MLPIIVVPILPVQDLLPLLTKLTISSDIYFHFIYIYTYIHTQIDFALQMQSLLNFTQSRHELLFRVNVAKKRTENANNQSS